jgi:hypothetical protein
MGPGRRRWKHPVCGREETGEATPETGSCSTGHGSLLPGRPNRGNPERRNHRANGAKATSCLQRGTGAPGGGRRAGRTERGAGAGPGTSVTGAVDRGEGTQRQPDGTSVAAGNRRRTGTASAGLEGQDERDRFGGNGRPGWKGTQERPGKPRRTGNASAAPGHRAPRFTARPGAFRQAAHPPRHGRTILRNHANEHIMRGAGKTNPTSVSG